jgi:hypothetical protein
MHTEYRIDFIIFPSFSILQVRPNCIANYSTPLSILCFRLSGALAAPMKPRRVWSVTTAPSFKLDFEGRGPDERNGGVR